MNGLLRYTTILFTLFLIMMSGWLWHIRPSTISNFIVFNTTKRLSADLSYLIVPDEAKPPQLIGDEYPEPQGITEPPIFSPDGHRGAVIYGLSGWQSVYMFSLQDLQTVVCWTCNSSVNGDRRGLAWSPDGQWLSYFIEERSGVAFVEIIDKTGQHIERLYDDIFFIKHGYPIRSPYTSPQWSSDARTIFVATKAAHPHPGGYIVSIDIQSKETTQLTETSHNFREFKVSPNGKWIAVISKNIYLLSTQPETRQSRKLLELAENQDITNLSWSPDGQHLIFNLTSDEIQTEPGNLYKMDLNGEYQLIGDLGVNENLAVWSPDGKWIAFIAENETGHDLYRMRPDGSHRQQLTDLGTLKPNYAPRWVMYPDYPIHYHYLAMIVGSLLGLAMLLTRYSNAFPYWGRSRTSQSNKSS